MLAKEKLLLLAAAMTQGPSTERYAGQGGKCISKGGESMCGSDPPPSFSAIFSALGEPKSKRGRASDMSRRRLEMARPKASET